MQSRWKLALAGVVALALGCGDGEGAAVDASDVGADATDTSVAADTDLATDAGGDAVATADSVEDAGADGVDGEVGPDLGTWRALAPLPKPIQENAVLLLDDTMYVVGGFDDRGAELDDVVAYDFDADRWEAAPALPHAVHHANGAAAGGRLWVLGALSGGFAADNVAWSWAPGEQAWSEATPIETARRRGAAAVVVEGDDIYVIGGLRGGSVADVDVYDTVAGTWAPLPGLPDALDHLTAELVGRTIYVIGGRGTSITSHQATTWAYDLDGEGAWVERAPMPTSRGGHVSGVVGGRIIVAGGEGNPEAGTMGVFAAVEAYDPAQDAWTALTPMRTPRHGTGAVGYQGALWVPGGASRIAFGAVDTVEVLDPGDGFPDFGLTLGTTDADFAFTPFAPGAHAEIVQGPQGGIHLDVAISVALPEAVATSASVGLDAHTRIDGEEVGSRVLERLDLVRVSAGTYQSGSTIVVFDTDLAAPYVGETAVVDVTVTWEDLRAATSATLQLVDRF